MLSHMLAILMLVVALGQTQPPADSRENTAAPSTSVELQQQDTNTGDSETATASNAVDGAQSQASQPNPKKSAFTGANLVQTLENTYNKTTWFGWLILFSGILAGLIAGRVAQTLLRKLSEKLAKRGWAARSSVFRYAANPANLALIGIGLGMGLNAGPVLDDQLKTFAVDSIGLISVIAMAWFLYNLVDIVELGIRRITTDTTIIQLIRKALRIFLLVVFGLFIAQNFFGANITAWLAGLGLAGLAVSLAAQGPIKNIFGSVTIVLDRPFGIGDRIKYGSYAGTVEAMGFRSTKLRTFEGHLVTIPNSKLIEDVVENISVRPSIRRQMNVTITYDTPPDKIELAVRIVRDLLTEPFMTEAFNMADAPPRAFFNDFNADSLNIQVTYWYQLNVEGRDVWTFNAHCQEFNLKLFRAFGEAGIEFAFPTQTLYLAGDTNRQLSVHVQSSNGHLLHPAEGIHSGNAPALSS